MSSRAAFRHAARLDAHYRELEEILARGEGPANVFGLAGSQKALILSLLSENEANGVFCLVADDLRARSLLAECQAFLPPERVLWLRNRPVSFVDSKAQSLGGERRRLAALSGLNRGLYDVTIASAAACLNRLPTPARFQADHLTLGRGQSADPEWLAAELVRLGYVGVGRVEGAGEFARRGDVLDIGLALPFDDGVQGLRLSFFDIEIEDLRRFDVDTQRASGLWEGEAQVFPAREVTLREGQERSRLASAIRQAGREAEHQALASGLDRTQAEKRRLIAENDALTLEAGLLPAALDRWLPLVHEEETSLLDYAREAGCLVAVDEPLRFFSRLAAARADFHQQVTAFLESGHVLPLATASGLSNRTVGVGLDSLPRVLALAELAGSGNGLPGGRTLSIRGQEAERYHGREEALAAALRPPEQRRVLFAGSQNRVERMTAFLQKEAVSGVDVLPFSLATGFFWPAARLFILGEDDVFGVTRSKVRRAGKGLTIDLLSDLEAGELVVHEAHGIGRYEGMVRLETSQGMRDYLKISYADAALHIPMEKLEQIQKYIRSGEKPPRLSKMGGVEWQRRKERAQKAIRRLAVDLARLYAQRERTPGHAFSPDTVWQQEFEDQFPYEETPDQLRAIEEIKRDMESPRVMDRLLCGDVGFGKTEICFRAMFKCVMDGKQAALLAPTTVLTDQHYETLKERLAGFPVTLKPLSRFSTPRERRETVRDLAEGRVDFVIGTHRLLSKDVSFKDLGLLIIDEEQRFGVDHKERFKAAYPSVDVLSLTATPIPRTLHMSLSGIRDISILEEGPDDRRPIQTYVMMADEEILAEAILREVGRNGQVFYLYNRVDGIEAKAVWWQQRLPGARIAVAHGQMSEKRLEETITAFLKQEYDILLCTTIIESGIDMPNVNTLIVEDADRLGLAQLYQIRGRVGRSERQAYAYITYRPDLEISELAQKRLTAIRDFTALGSGLKIALKDLEVRGAGDLLGAEQSGHLEAIGYDLYTKLLDEAVREITGQPLPAARKTASVEFRTDAFLPKAYVHDEAERLDLYRKIAAIDDRERLQDVEAELADRFGPLPAEAQRLVDVAFVRAFAERHGIERLTDQGSDLVLWLDRDLPVDMNLLQSWLATPAYRGRLFLNAGHRPHILVRDAAADPRRTAANLRELFSIEAGKGAGEPSA